MDRGEAHRVLETHLPAPKRLGRRLRCACGEMYPCHARQVALDELEGRQRGWWRS